MCSQKSLVHRLGKFRSVGQKSFFHRYPSKKIKCLTWQTVEFFLWISFCCSVTDNLQHRSSATAETVCSFIMTEIERKCEFQKLKQGWTLIFHKNSPLDSKLDLSTLTQKKVTIQIDSLEKTFWIVRSICGEKRKSHLLSESQNQSCFSFSQIPKLSSQFPQRRFQAYVPVKKYQFHINYRTRWSPLILWLRWVTWIPFIFTTLIRCYSCKEFLYNRPKLSNERTLTLLLDSINALSTKMVWF